MEGSNKWEKRISNSPGIISHIGRWHHHLPVTWTILNTCLIVAASRICFWIPSKMVVDAVRDPFTLLLLSPPHAKGAHGLHPRCPAWGGFLAMATHVGQARDKPEVLRTCWPYKHRSNNHRWAVGGSILWLPHPSGGIILKCGSQSSRIVLGLFAHGGNSPLTGFLSCSVSLPTLPLVPLSTINYFHSNSCLRNCFS